MSSEQIAPIAGLLGTAAVLPSWLSYRLAERSRRNEQCRGAARELTEALEALRSVVRRHGEVSLTPAEASAAVLGWGTAFARHDHELPTTYRRIDRNVQAALGELLGLVALAHRFPRFTDAPLAAPNSEWQENAELYLGYCRERIAEWGDGKLQRKVLSFDEWLARRRRLCHL